MSNSELTDKDYIDAIKRSGYLFEVEIANMLLERGYFVQANEIIKDPITEKSREIDLLAEKSCNTKKEEEYYISSIISFVLEVKNNDYPLVLLNKHTFSLNFDSEDLFKETVIVPNNVEYDHSYVYYKNLYIESQDIFTQYCSFNTKKQKNELLACHPENLYEGLSKITFACEEKKENFEGLSNKFFRHFLYLPVLIIKKDLFELEVQEKSEIKLKKVDFSQLVFKYHYKGIQKNALIFIVTEKGLPIFLQRLQKLESHAEELMIKTLKNTSPDSA